MSLEVDGVWKAGVWATTVWADGVWREGEVVTPPADAPVTGGGWVVSNLYSQFEEWKEKKRLEAELARQQAALKAVEKKKEIAEAKSVQEKPPAGILANLHRLEVREQKIEKRIETIQFRLDELEMILQGLAAKKLLEDDEDDFESIMFQ